MRWCWQDHIVGRAGAISKVWKRREGEKAFAARLKHAELWKGGMADCGLQGFIPGPWGIRTQRPNRQAADRIEASVFEPLTLMRAISMGVSPEAAHAGHDSVAGDDTREGAVETGKLTGLGHPKSAVER